MKKRYQVPDFETELFNISDIVSLSGGSGFTDDGDGYTDETGLGGL